MEKEDVVLQGSFEGRFHFKKGGECENERMSERSRNDVKMQRERE